MIGRPDLNQVLSKLVPNRSAVSAIGPIMQLGFVPRDWDAALAFWIRLGVGPFLVTERVRTDELRYRGTLVDIDYSLALAYWGDIQIELIRQNDHTPSIYREWLESGRSGVHHVCAVTDNIDVARELCQASGGEVIQDLTVAGGAAIYVDFGDDGPLYEAVELPEIVAVRFADMKAVARDWDGIDPVRVRQV